MALLNDSEAPPGDDASREESRLLFGLVLAGLIAEDHLTPVQIDAFLEVAT